MMTDSKLEAHGRSDESAEPVASRRAAPALTRERVTELLQVEIDRHGPLDNSRRAAAILAEASIRFTDEPGTAGFVIVGPDGAPRTTIRDGRTVPFTLADLAADIRSKYPTLFKRQGSEAPPAVHDVPPSETAASSRDWLLLGSEEGGDTVAAGAHAPEEAAARPAEAVAKREHDVAGDPAQAGARASWRDALRHVHARTLGAWMNRSTAQAQSTARTEASHPSFAPDVSTRARFRPSYAVYAGVLVVVGVTIAVLASGPSEPTSENGASEQATAEQGPASTGAVATSASGPAGAPADAIAGTAEVVDTSTLRIDGKLVRLFGVEWARGGRPEDLTSYIAGREVVCTPAARPDRYKCQVEGRDLSRVVLYNGGGRAAPEATPELKAAEDHARAAGLGVWQKP